MLFYFPPVICVFAYESLKTCIPCILVWLGNNSMLYLHVVTWSIQTVGVYKTPPPRSQCCQVYPPLWLERLCNACAKRLKPHHSILHLGVLLSAQVWPCWQRIRIHRKKNWLCFRACGRFAKVLRSINGNLGNEAGTRINTISLSAALDAEVLGRM